MPAMMIVSPKSTWLTSLANARADLGITADRMSDADLSRKIEVASDSAASYCDRAFGVATYRETFRNAHYGRELILDMGPVISIVSVSTRNVAMAVDQYEFEGQSLYSMSGAGARRDWYPSLITVDYVAGYLLPGEDPGTQPALAPKLPANVEQACQQLMGAAISAAGRGDPMIKTTEIQGVGRREYYVQGSRAQLAHPEAEATLERYRHMVLV